MPFKALLGLPKSNKVTPGDYFDIEKIETELQSIGQKHK